MRSRPRLGPPRRRTRSRGSCRQVARGGVATRRARPGAILGRARPGRDRSRSWRPWSRPTCAAASPGASARGRRLPRALPRPPRRGRAGPEPDLRGVLPPRGAGRAARRRAFCDRYAPWRDSLASQLKYHQLLSRVVGPTAAAAAVPRARRAFPGVRASIRSWARGERRGSTWRANDLARGPRGRAEGLARPRPGAVDPWGGSTTRTSSRSTRVVYPARDAAPRPVMPYRPGLPLDEVIRRVDPASRPRTARVLWDVVAAAAPTDAAGTLDGRAGRGMASRSGGPTPRVWPGSSPRWPAPWPTPTAREIYHRDIKPANILLTLQRRPAAPRLQPGPRPALGRPGRGGPARRDAPLHGPRAARGVPRSRTLGRGRRRRRPLLARPGAARAPDRPGRPRSPDPTLPLPRAIRDLLDRRIDSASTSVGGSTRRSPTPSRRSPRAAWRTAPRTATPTPRPWPTTSSGSSTRRPLAHAVNPSRRERLGNWAWRNRLRAGRPRSSSAVIAGPRLPAPSRIYPIDGGPDFLAAVGPSTSIAGQRTCLARTAGRTEPRLAPGPVLPGCRARRTGERRQGAEHVFVGHARTCGPHALAIWGRSIPGSPTISRRSPISPQRSGRSEILEKKRLSDGGADQSEVDRGPRRGGDPARRVFGEHLAALTRWNSLIEQANCRQIDVSPLRRVEWSFNRASEPDSCDPLSAQPRPRAGCERTVPSSRRPSATASDSRRL